MADTYSDRVAKGAALLDEHEPDWWTRINIEGLDMALPWAIAGGGGVLAQTYSQEQDLVDEGGYYIGLRHLNASGRAVELGFDIEYEYAVGTHKEAVALYNVLRDAWIREIQTRRANG